MDLFDDVGVFVQGYDMYLQAPRGCDRNVKYRNPHRLSGLDQDVPMTFDLFPSSNHVEATRTAVDLLADMETDEILLETDTPLALRTELYK